ncbi:hypothetical protein [uncultured Corynebacterium sp.]|uniref:hypothetical protein n=1 Tax=uncultured Corynebacterium sp. TaxID=159447 RepID=UPI0025DDD6C5|nr:hypothetical protein [uncultured Corynebacterium sp.]
MSALGSYTPIKVHRDPDETPLETIQKTLAALEAAKAEVDENKRRAEAEAARKRQSFFGRLFR